MKKVFRFLYQANENMCKLFLILLVLVVSYVVFGRFVLNETPRWGEEIGLTLMVWIAFLSASLAIHDEKHLKLSLLDLFLPKRMLRWIDRIHTFGIMVFAVFLVLEGIALVEIGRLNRMPGLGITSFWFYLVVPISGAVMIIHCIERIFRKENHELQQSGEKL